MAEAKNNYRTDILIEVKLLYNQVWSSVDMLKVSLPELGKNHDC